MEFRYAEANGYRVSVVFSEDNFIDSLRIGYSREKGEEQTNDDCLDCKYFSGDRRLRCAVNPTRRLKENCPDFVKKNKEEQNNG